MLVSESTLQSGQLNRRFADRLKGLVDNEQLLIRVPATPPKENVVLCYERMLLLEEGRPGEQMCTEQVDDDRIYESMLKYTKEWVASKDYYPKSPSQ